MHSKAGRWGAAAAVLLVLQAAAARAAYHVAGHLGEGRLSRIVQLTAAPDDTLYVLEAGGKVVGFSPDGKEKVRFDTGLLSAAALAVDRERRLYLFSTVTRKKKVKVRSRLRVKLFPVGVKCVVFSPDGSPQGERSFPTLKSVRTAHFVGNRLVIADLAARALVILDPATGKETARISKGLRLCCGIFDFAPAPADSLIVANLGAFKVQRFDLDGKLLEAFGERGRAPAAFHGCCNPVSAAWLPDGRIVTVEKDPTRVKIYSADRKSVRSIKGIEELVKGCSFIPLAVDSKGTIYLGAAKGYIVVCKP